MELTFAQQVQQFAANHTIMVIAWVAIFLAVLYTFFKGATSKHKAVDNNEATRLINREDAVVLDVRATDDFAAGHIINSLNILPSEIKGGKIQALEKYRGQPIIVADVNGLTAGSIADALVKQGFAKVYTLKDGIAGWRGANLPTVKKK